MSDGEPSPPLRWRGRGEGGVAPASAVSPTPRHSLRVVIELDGGVNDLPGRARHDAKRDGLLASRGYRAPRIPNEHVLRHPTRVPASIGIA